MMMMRMASSSEATHAGDGTAATAPSANTSSEGKQGDTDIMRDRANTLPSPLNGSDATPQVLSPSERSSRSVDNIDLAPKEQSPTAPVNAAGKNDDDEDEDDDDPELRAATAMAMAFQENPHLTPDELRKLVQKKEEQYQQQKAAAKAAKKQKAASTAAASSASTATAADTNSSSNTTAAATSPTASVSVTSAAVSTNNNSGGGSTSAPLIPGRLASMFSKEGSNGKEGAEAAAAAAAAAASTTAEGGSSKHKSVRNSFMQFNSQIRNTRGKLHEILSGNQNQSEAQQSAADGGTSPSMSIPNPSNASSSGAGGIRLPFRSGVGNPLVRTAPQVKSPPITPSASNDVAVDVFGGGLTTSVANTGNSGAVPIRLQCIAWKRRGGMGKYKTVGAWERRRIELQGAKLLYYLHDEDDEQQNNNDDGTAVPTAATTLSPSALDAGGSPMPQPPLGAPAANGSEISLPPVMSEEQQDQDFPELVVNKRTTWLEQAASTLTGNAASSAADDMTNPRGYLDLGRERATVSASLGHSGAPSPFALSIKVRNETKWKLCFDTHKQQMEWLAAITDVVISTSVDAYNASLLMQVSQDAAGGLSTSSNHQQQQLDSSGSGIAAGSTALGMNMFQPSPVNEPPTSPTPTSRPVAAIPSTPQPQSTTTGGGQHRLWMMDDYVIRSANAQQNLTLATTTSSSSDATVAAGASTTRDIAGDDAENEPYAVEEDDGGDAPGIDNGLDDAGEVEKSRLEWVQDQASKAWSIPESNFLAVAAVVNGSLAIARSSTTSMSGFWYLVAFTNLGVFLCTRKEPDWRNCVLQYAKTITSLGTYGQKQTTTTTNREGGTMAAPLSFKNKKVSKATKRTDATKKDVAGSALSGTSNARDVKSYKPVAGTSAIRLNEPSDPPYNSKDQMFAGWRTPSGDTMMVRSHGYMSSKEKIPSPGELFECVQLDVFESPQRYPDMAPRVKLPEVQFDDGGKPKTWRTPDIFIISIALPTDPPKMSGSKGDGGGYTMTVYYVMKQETRDILRRVTADGYDPSKEAVPENVQKSKVNAVRLFEEWCRRAPNDPKFQARFKVVPNAHNLKEIGMPSWISKYNGKPFLIKRPGETGFLYSHPELNCMEFDISLHPFPWLAKQAICYMKDSYFKKVLVSFGFVIEGRSDDELPECVIGAFQMCYPDPVCAIQAKDFFSGTSPRSFEVKDDDENSTPTESSKTA